MLKVDRLLIAFAILLLTTLRAQPTGTAQQVTGQDIDKILERADKLFDEAKAGYEQASAKGAVAGFVDAGFKLEEARIKYLVLQEIGSAEKQNIAADRLRAVNQLNKLIHDGKVAVVGSPAEPAPSRAVDPGPSKNPSNPAAPAAKVRIDVSKRSQIPNTEKQREAEKVIKDLYKEQYARKNPEERKTLARLLLDQSAKPQDDPAILWVLCREAQEAATQVCEVKTLMCAIDTAAAAFDVDAMLMKSGALTAAGKAAKAPEEFKELAEALFKLIDDLIQADQYDSADKMAILASTYARKFGDPPLVSRATLRAKEITEAKALYQSMKGVLEAQAKNPDDAGANLEIGKFLCFVKGSWDMGLRFMVKGSDASLKALAEKELAIPAQPSERVALADGWYDLGDKDRSPLRKSQLLEHAKVVYEGALLESSGVVRAKIEKRLGEIETRMGPAGGIDLLQLIDLPKDVVTGQWSLASRVLTAPATENSKLELPYLPPEEYELNLVVEVIGSGSSDAWVVLSLPMGPKNAAVFIWGDAASIEYVDGKSYQSNTTKTPGLMAKNRKTSVTYSVRKALIKVYVDGKPALEWKGDFNRLTNPAWGGRNPRAISVCTQAIVYKVTKITLIPVSGGQGKKLH